MSQNINSQNDTIKSKWFTLKDILKGDNSSKQLRCENCDRVMKEYEGKHGKFLGCPNFMSDENCRNTYTIGYKS